MYSEIVPHTATPEEIAAREPVGIILSGGPSSVYEEGAPALDPGVLELGVPTLGICYGFQAMAKALGGEVAHTGLREYGATDATIVTEGTLLQGQPVEQNVWMSHGDQVAKAPEGFDVLASTESRASTTFVARMVHGTRARLSLAARALTCRRAPATNGRAREDFQCGCRSDNGPGIRPLRYDEPKHSYVVAGADGSPIACARGQITTGAPFVAASNRRPIRGRSRCGGARTFRGC